MNRTVACLSVRHLEIAVIRLTDCSLATRPVAIVEATPSGASVRDVSDEGAADGVAAGMTPHEAQAVCPGITLVQHSRQRLRRARECLWTVVAERAPLWEPEGTGAVYADFSGTARLLGAGVDIVRRIMGDLADRHGFDMAAGVGTNKLVTHIAADGLSGPGVCDVRPGDERQFVSPFPLRVLPQAGRRSWRPIFDILEDLNLGRLGMIAAAPLPHLSVAVGPAAATLHRSANGVDDRAVTPPQHRPSITVAQSLGSGEIDRTRIAGTLYGMLETVCRRLRAMGRMCVALGVIAVYADYAEVRCAFRPARASQWEHDLAPAIDAALARAAARRVRIRNVALEVETAMASAQLELPLVDPPPRARAADHSHPPDGRRRELSSTLDAIRNRFGDPAIGWGRVPRLATPA